MRASVGRIVSWRAQNGILCCIENSRGWVAAKIVSLLLATGETRVGDAPNIEMALFFVLQELASQKKKNFITILTVIKRKMCTRRLCSVLVLLPYVAQCQGLSPYPSFELTPSSPILLLRVLLVSGKSFHGSSSMEG